MWAAAFVGAKCPVLPHRQSVRSASAKILTIVVVANFFLCSLRSQRHFKVVFSRAFGTHAAGDNNGDKRRRVGVNEVRSHKPSAGGGNMRGEAWAKWYLIVFPQKAVLNSDVSELPLNNESLMLIKKNKSFPSRRQIWTIKKCPLKWK